MTGADQIGRFGLVTDSGQHRGGAVSGRNAGADTAPGLDGYGKTGFEGRCVVIDHERQIERIHFFRCQRQADQATAICGHEVDGVRRDFFGGHAEIAFIFAIFVIHENDHFAGADVLDSLFNR